MLIGNRGLLTSFLTLLFTVGLFTTGGIGCGGDGPESTPEASSSVQTPTVQTENNENALTESISAIDTNTTSGMESGAVVGGTSTSDNATTGNPAQNGSMAEKNGADKSGAAATDAPAAAPTAAPAAGTETGDASPSGYDPAVFDRLLKSFVSNGRVDYAGFKRSDEFARFLETIGSASPSSMSTNEALAFWVNAYNAMVIKNVNDNPGIKQPLDVSGFFDAKKFRVAGRSVTLNQIENEIVRPTYREPLIHFGLVCAARSCPPLIRTAYTASNVRSQLASNARAYLADSKQNRFDPATGTLALSKIFEWYKEDFGGNDAGLIAFAKKYGPAEMKQGLEAAENPTVTFLEYDWTLNKK